MNKHSREMLDAYYGEAASWNRDRVQSMRTSHRVAWITAGVASLVAVFEVIALVILLPLKTVVPYTLIVDRTTGFVEALKPLDVQTMAPDSALTQSFLVQYVIAREGFDTTTLNTNYRKVALFSAGPARDTYLRLMQVSNPESPIVKYPRSSTVDVRVKSVSPIGANAALVRFDTVRGDANGRAQPPNSWVAVIRYHYSAAPMSVEDRYVNPLGFQIASYRKDPEALPAARADETNTPRLTAATQLSAPIPNAIMRQTPNSPYYAAAGSLQKGARP